MTFYGKCVFIELLALTLLPLVWNASVVLNGLGSVYVHQPKCEGGGCHEGRHWYTRHTLHRGQCLILNKTKQVLLSKVAFTDHHKNGCDVLVDLQELCFPFPSNVSPGLAGLCRTPWWSSWSCVWTICGNQRDMSSLLTSTNLSLQSLKRGGILR